MVFWTTYPFWNTILWKKERFIKQPFHKNSIETSYSLIYEWITPINSKEICDYLYTYFGSPPRTPILDIPEDQLLGPLDHLLVVRDLNRDIIGTIRYHYSGIFNNEKIYCVDCFCIHPSWRGKGIGDQLLSRLHIYANERNIPYAIFLKEGTTLSILHLPLYTGTYVYRKIDTIYKNRNIMDLTITQAHHLLQIYENIYPNLVIIKNKYSQNQLWKIYKNGIHSILVCFQDTYQRKEGKRMAWATAWLESPLITDTHRCEASTYLSDRLYPAFDYVWMNRLWIGSSKKWHQDGTFHWYSYQWSTGSMIHRSYCIPH